MKPSSTDTGIAGACAFVLLLAGTFLVYAPGLSGDFLLDDWINLDALGKLGGIDGWRTAAEYLLGSHTGSGGRPVALASFLLDGVDWPTAPRPFKYTSILFHLLTVVGVVWLALQVARALGYDRRRQYAVALLAGAVWGLHPLMVSTVLYVVQRMAVLAALFVVFGLGCYVQGRRLLADGRARAGYAWMTAGLTGFTALAFLSKPNGALLPLLALVLDATVLGALAVPERDRTRWRLWRAVFVYLPIAAIAGYFAINWDSRVLSGYLSRPFSLTERLLTESRVLVDYVLHLLIPRIQTAGLYHDNYTVSTGLLDPPTTLLAALAVIGALAAGIRLRRRLPVLSAGILFFLAGHALESTFIPLEIYFEHRNYLPSVGLALAAAIGIVRLADCRRLDHPRLAAGITAAVLVALFSTATFARAQLWGNPDQQALVWARENPGSVRAQQQAAITYMDRGLPVQAAERIAAGIRHNPDSSLLRVQHLVVACAYDAYHRSRLEAAARSIRENAFERHTIRQIELLGQYAVTGRCGELRIADVLRLVESALAHRGVQSRSRMVEELQYIRGRLLLADQRPGEAQQAFLSAVRVARNVEGALQMAALMATGRHYDNALALLDHAERDLARMGSGARQRLRHAAVDYRSEIERMRAQVHEDAGPAAD